MKHKIDDLTLEEVNILALAMDHLLCNATIHPSSRDTALDLFTYLDVTADELEEKECRSRDNILVVDFTPKNR